MSPQPHMQLSFRGALHLMDAEGTHPEVYLDSGGAPTIGIGHLITRAERRSGKIWINGRPERYLQDGLSHREVLHLFAQDVQAQELVIRQRVQVPLVQYQYDALVSFIFNVGGDAFKNSTLLRQLNEKRYDDVPAQLRRWVYDNGQIVEGLKNRREKEVQLWEGHL